MSTRGFCVLLALLVTVSPAVVAAEQAKLEGLYTGVRRDAGLYPRVSKDYLVFFPDGTAYWRLPDEGLLNFDARAERAANPEFWGSYHLAQGEFTVRWPTGRVSEGKVLTDGRIEFEGFTYVHKDSADGYRLSGTYRPANLEPGNDHTITFSADGRFRDEGVRVVVGLMDLAYGRPRVPTHPGEGNYFIASNSIVLEYDDGRREQLSFYTSDRASASPEFVVIHTYELDRTTRQDSGSGEGRPDVTALRSAADAGDAAAQWMLGYLYYTGEGLAQDYTAAVRWFRLAAEQGLPGAQLSLGHLYRQGLGTKRDDEQAANWYRLAAEQGEVEAQYITGALYADGVGVTKDLVQAYLWLDLAASAASAEQAVEIAGMREQVAHLMTREQIAEAQKLSSSWKARQPD